jgi:hypothetical protein
VSDALAAWTPALPVFLRRCAVVGAVSIAAVALAGWAIGEIFGIWQVLYVGPVLLLAYNIAFEDPARWRVARQSRWKISLTRAQGLAGLSLYFCTTACASGCLTCARRSKSPRKSLPRATA